MKTLTVVMLMLIFVFGANAQSQIVPIVHRNYLVGGVGNGKWVKELDVVKSLAKQTKFIGFDAFDGLKPLDMYGTRGEMGCGATYFYFDESKKIPEDVFAGTGLNPVVALGANATWNPVPRRAKKLSLTDASLKKIAIDFLKSKGIAVKNVKLENAFSVDLDGDGVSESFLEATNYVDKNGELDDVARKGGYSFVMMRGKVGGKIRDVLVAGEFHAKKPVDADYLSEVEISQFADLNGDGKLEVVLETIYSYGGESTEIYEFQLAGLRNVLSVECGD